MTYIQRIGWHLTACLAAITLTALTLGWGSAAPAQGRPDHRGDAVPSEGHRVGGDTPPSMWPVGEDSGGRRVSWAAPRQRHASYRNARRWWGAATTKIRIRGPRAPHVFPFHLDLPAHTRLHLNRFGEVVARRHGHRIGMLARPWAKDRRGHRVRTWYTVRGHIVKQHVRFDRHARFPLHADPWWNPVSWDWGSAFHVAWREVRSCGSGATKEVLGLAGGTVALNVLLKHVAGRVALALPGGAYAYAGTAVYGCIGSYY